MEWLSCLGDLLVKWGLVRLDLKGKKEGKEKVRRRGRRIPACREVVFPSICFSAAEWSSGDEQQWLGAETGHCGANVALSGNVRSLVRGSVPVGVSYLLVL